MKKMTLLILLGCFVLSGCAGLQVRTLSDLNQYKPLPKTLVISEFVLDKKVQLPPEEVKKGREILYATLEKELPNFKISLEAPDGEDYLIVKTRIMYIRKSKPGTLLVPTFALLGTSLCSFEGVVSLCQKSKPGEEIEIFKVSTPKDGMVAAGQLKGKYGAYYSSLEMMARNISTVIKKQD